MSKPTTEGRVWCKANVTDLRAGDTIAVTSQGIGVLWESTATLDAVIAQADRDARAAVAARAAASLLPNGHTSGAILAAERAFMDASNRMKAAWDARQAMIARSR
jgi:hypothetical protein